MADFTVSTLIDALMQSADAPAARTVLGLGTLATQSGTFSGTSSGTNTGDQTTISGNSGTATKLATARNINSVLFDGSADITVTAAAGTLTGTTLNSTVTASSLTSIGTLGSLTVSGTANIGTVQGTFNGTTVSGSTATFSAASLFSGTGAASVSALRFTGTPFAGTGTTSFPLVYINESGATASTTLATAGTYFGINAHTGSGTTNFCDWMFDGASRFKVNSAGLITTTNDARIGGNINLNSRLWIATPSDGTAYISNNAVTGLTRFGFGGVTSSFSAFQISGTAITVGLADGSSGGLFACSGDFQLTKTVTAAGTTGAQTINKNSGTVNFAIAATSLVVTNSLVTVNSIIQCTVGTNDVNMKSVQAVAGAGSFTIFPNAAPAAETRVNFTVTN